MPLTDISHQFGYADMFRRVQYPDTWTLQKRIGFKASDGGLPGAAQGDPVGEIKATRVQRSEQPTR